MPQYQPVLDGAANRGQPGQTAILSYAEIVSMTPQEVLDKAAAE
jgi:hypothetical protein